MAIHFFESSVTRMRTHRIGEMAELIIMTGGVYQAHVPRSRNAPNADIRAQVGDVIYWPVNMERTEENDPAHPTRCLCLYFRWPRAPRDFPRIVRDQDHIIRLLAERLLAMWDRSWKIPPAVWDTYLGAILAECLRLSIFLADDIVDRVAHHITEHIDKPIRLEDLAHCVGMQRNHFGRKFKALTGQTPMQHLRRRRVEHAVGMLFTTKKRKLADVATRVGIDDERQLRRLMARYSTTTVREIRREAHRRKNDAIQWVTSQAGIAVRQLAETQVKQKKKN